MKNSYSKYVEDYIKKRMKQLKTRSNLSVSVITCTNLPYSLSNILENFIRQDYEKKELIIIINNNNIDEKEWIETTSKYDYIRVFKLDEKISLGKCLNFGVDRAKYDIIAKFDDDDYYGPKYLSDSTQYFNSTNAKVVGKGTTLIYFVASEILSIREPGKENKYVKFVNGSTLVFKKEVFDKVRFRDISLTEDVHFCNDCIKKGIKVYSSSRYHHVYFRHPSKENHTWKIKDEEFLSSYCSTDVLKKHLDNIDDIRRFADI
ncbi:glycosyltransferase [Clostridium sp. Cult2]|uniref:glycosyltransferase n=1 Tax=Clostridium sp. Cult2 TaxID=2079003 RepID=UPI001F431B15|nr:glycosyltransferase family 2 protein [Clostridium sp. Cult2]